MIAIQTGAKYFKKKLYIFFRWNAEEYSTSSIIFFKPTTRIISRQVEEIRQIILAEVDRGVTVLYGEGGYLQEETKVVLSILSNRELPKLERLIRDIDPEAFMIVSRVTEVRGKGFSISREYR